MWIVLSGFMTFYLAMFLFLPSTISYIYYYYHYYPPLIFWTGNAFIIIFSELKCCGSEIAGIQGNKGWLNAEMRFGHPDESGKY